MKKVVYAAAVLAMCATPLNAMAEGTTLYGQLRYSVNSVDEDTATGIDGWSGEDNVSLLGLKGSYGDEIKAFFHLQTGANADGDGEGDAFDQRFFFGGLEGVFGKVAYGRMTNAYKFDGFIMDPFYNYSRVNAGGAFAAGGATYGLSGATNGFTDNSLQYVSPSLAGFKLTGGFYIDDSDADNSNDDHAYLAGVSYTFNDLTTGVMYGANNGSVTLPGIDADGDAVRAYANYKFNDTLKTSLSVENVDINAADDANYIYLTSTMMAPSIKMDFSASLGVVTDGPAEGVGVTAGAWYNVAEHTKLFALVSYADIGTSGSYGDIDKEPLVFSFGAQHKFSLSTK